jgi:hypothetical protein
MLLSTSILKSSFKPGAANSISSLVSVSFKFTDGKFIPIEGILLSAQSEMSLVKKSSNRGLTD